MFTSCRKVKIIRIHIGQMRNWFDFDQNIIQPFNDGFVLHQWEETDSVQLWLFLTKYVYAIEGSDGHYPLSTRKMVRIRLLNENSLVNTIERYDPKTNKWSSIVAMDSRRSGVRFNWRRNNRIVHWSFTRRLISYISWRRNPCHEIKRPLGNFSLLKQLYRAASSS